eukprot:jgi/Botrbrau1/14271/Bobra.0368s0003.1
MVNIMDNAFHSGSFSHSSSSEDTATDNDGDTSDGSHTTSSNHRSRDERSSAVFSESETLDSSDDETELQILTRDTIIASLSVPAKNTFSNLKTKPQGEPLQMMASRQEPVPMHCPSKNQHLANKPGHIRRIRAYRTHKVWPSGSP